MLTRPWSLFEPHGVLPPRCTMQRRGGLFEPGSSRVCLCIWGHRGKGKNMPGAGGCQGWQEGGVCSHLTAPLG